MVSGNDIDRIRKLSKPIGNPGMIRRFAVLSQVAWNQQKVQVLVLKFTERDLSGRDANFHEMGLIRVLPHGFWKRNMKITNNGEAKVQGHRTGCARS